MLGPLVESFLDDNYVAPGGIPVMWQLIFVSTQGRAEK